MDDETRHHLAGLEHRLSAHFAELKDNIGQRDTFLLGSTWGIVKSAWSIGIFLGTIKLLNWLALEGWVWGVGFWVVFIAAVCVTSPYLDKKHKQDENRLHHIMDWERRSPYD